MLWFKKYIIVEIFVDEQQKTREQSEVLEIEAFLENNDLSNEDFI